MLEGQLSCRGCAPRGASPRLQLWNPHFHRRATSGPALYLQPASHERGPFAHSDDAMVPIADGLRVKALPIVVDSEGHGTLGHAQRDGDLVGPGMGADVGECFLGDAEELDLDA